MQLRPQSLKIVFFALLLLASFAPLTTAVSDPLTDARAYLSSTQSAGGTWGYAPLFSPIAIHALLASSPADAKSLAGAQFMADDLRDANSFSWSEADLPGLELYALGKAGKLSLLSASDLDGIKTRLIALQQPSGGFAGWFAQDSQGNFVAVEDAVDTAWAVLGMKEAGMLDDAQGQTIAASAVAYLTSLETVADGHIRFTDYTTPSTEDSSGLSSLGPDTTSTTALVLLALNSVGHSSGTTTRGLDFLKTQAQGCFGNSGKAFDASMAALAFDAFGADDYAASAERYLYTIQDASGGFADDSRGAASKPANALDTGFAAYAMMTADESRSTFSCAPASNAALALTTPILPSASESIRVTVNNAAISSVDGTVTKPNAGVVPITLVYNSGTHAYAVAFTDTSALGTYQVSVTIHYIGGNTQTLTSNFVVASAVQVAVVNSKPDGDSRAYCVTVPDGDTAENAIKASGAVQDWASFSFGDALASLEGVGCSVSDPFCQCADWNVCCLTWNFWLKDAASGTPNAWAYQFNGYGGTSVNQGDVVGSFWTANANKAPLDLSFDDACVTSPAVSQQTADPSTQPELFDALSCTACTANAQCSSNYCVHGTCRAGPTYCGDGFCDASVESTSTCSADCATPANNAVSTPTPKVHVKIDFPSSADIEADIDASLCTHALECLQKAASISCQNYPAAGALACSGVTQSCLITGVNGVSQTSSLFWSFYASGTHAAQGVSCYTPSAGQTLELRFEPDSGEGQSSSQNQATSTPTPGQASPSPSVSASPSATATPSVTPNPSGTPSATPSTVARQSGSANGGSGTQGNSQNAQGVSGLAGGNAGNGNLDSSTSDSTDSANPLTGLFTGALGENAGTGAWIGVLALAGFASLALARRFK